MLVHVNKRVRDTSFHPLGDSDRPNFRVHSVKGDFYFPILTRAPSSMSPGAEMKKLPPVITRSIHCVKQGQREDNKQAKMLCVNMSGLGDLKGVFPVSLLQIKEDCLQIICTLHLL